MTARISGATPKFLAVVHTFSGNPSHHLVIAFRTKFPLVMQQLEHFRIEHGVRGSQQSQEFTFFQNFQGMPGSKLFGVRSSAPQAHNNAI